MSLPVNQIIQGDCLEIMKQWPDKCVDVVITDPPYGINIGKNGSVGGGSFRGATQQFENVGWDEQPPSDEYFTELFRVSKHQIIWGGNYFWHNLHRTRCVIVWYKRDGLPDRTFADCEIAWTSFDRNSKVINCRWDGFIRDSKEKKVHHPTQKPLQVMKECIECFTSKSDLILDCFAGSGSTLVAAELLGRKWIGIELDPNYCQIARDRIEAAKQGITVKEFKQGQMSLWEAQC